MKRKLFTKALLNFRNISIPALLAAATVAGQQSVEEILNISSIVLPAGLGVSVVMFCLLD